MGKTTARLPASSRASTSCSGEQRTPSGSLKPMCVWASRMSRPGRSARRRSRNGVTAWSENTARRLLGRLGARRSGNTNPMAEVRHLRLGGNEAPGAARDFVCSVADEAFADAELTDSLRLVVSEVVTNSIRHGQAGRDGCVDLVLRVDGRRLRLEVADGGQGFEPEPTRGRP